MQIIRCATHVQWTSNAELIISSPPTIRRVNYLRLLVLFLFVFFCVRAHALELLTNGGFESGNTSNWIVYNPDGQPLTWSTSTTAPHSGTYCATLTTFGGSTSDLIIYARANVSAYTPGTMVKARIWVKTTGLACTDGLYSVLATWNASYSQVLGYCSGAGNFTGTHDWTPIEFFYEIPPHGAYMEISIRLNNAITGGSISFDDASIEAVQNATPNFLTNGGFEQNWTTGWAQWPTTNFTVTRESSGQMEGGYCLKAALNSATTGATLNQDLAFPAGINAGDTLRLSAWFKTGTDIDASKHIRLVVCYGTDGVLDGNTWQVLTDYVGAQTTWKWMGAEFTHRGAPYNCMRVLLYMDGCLPGPSTIYWDDVRLEKDETAGALSTAIPLCELSPDVAGTPRLKINGTTQTPAFFFCNTGSPVLSDEVSKAATAGVNLIQVPMELPWNGTNTGILEQVIQANPNAKILPRIYLEPPNAWEAAHTGHYLLNENGAPISSNAMSLASEEYFTALKHQLDHFVRYLHNSSYKDRIIGYHLETGEWFYSDTAYNYYDYNPYNLARFQSWCQAKYGTLGGLNTAWGTALGAFSNITMPTTSEWETGQDGVFRSPANGYRKITDYCSYHNKMTADRILELSQKVKDLTTSKSLTAVFYGYQNELINNGYLRGTAHSGHLALRQLLASNAINILCSPFSYYQRTAGTPCNMHGIIDTVMRAGKLYLQENDSSTWLIDPTGYPDGSFCPWYSTESDTYNCERRDFGNIIAHNQATWWCDLWGDGRYNSQTFWDRMKTCVDSYSDSISNAEATRPQVALIYDEDSTFWLKANSYNLTNALGYQMRSIFQSMGVQVGYYHIQDLPSIPSSARLFIFVNTTRLSDAEKTLIDGIKSGGRTLMWMYAPGYVRESAFSLSEMTSLTGFTFSKCDTALNPKINVTNSGYPITDTLTGHIFSDLGSATIAPTFYVSGGTYVNLGNYDGTSRCGLAVQYNSGWRSIFCGAPKLSIQIARAIARESGVNLHNNAEVLDLSDSIAYNGRYLYAYTPAAGTRWFQLENEETANGGFERFSGSLSTSGFNQWLSPAYGSISGTAVTTSPHSGNSCFATASFSSAAGQYSEPLLQKVLLEDGTYDVSCWVRTTSLVSTNAGTSDYIYLVFEPNTWTSAAKSYPIAIGTTRYLSNNTWTQFTATYTHTRTSNQNPELRIVLKINGRYSATSIRVDDVSVRKTGSRTVTVKDSLTNTVLGSGVTGWATSFAQNEQKIFNLY